MLGEWTIQTISTFGEKEIAALKFLDMKTDIMHCFVPITWVLSKKLISNMLICTTTHELLLENIKLSKLKFHENFNDSENNVGFEINAAELSALTLT